MVSLELKRSFLSLVRLGIGQTTVEALPEKVDWSALQALAMQQGLAGIVIDGIGKLPSSLRPPKDLLLTWIGFVMTDENRCSIQHEMAKKMAELFHRSHIRSYVLKGGVVAECYPKPKRRVSSDLDCFLLPEQGMFDAWKLGNDLISLKGFEVATDFYKNSTFYLPGLTVENHKFITPFRGNKVLERFERLLQSLIYSDNGNDRFEGTWLYRPPVMASSMFLIEHAYSHFLHEGLTWRMVLDWMLFSNKHEKEIDWRILNEHINEFGFRKFYDSYLRLGQYLIGEFQEENLSIQDKMMLDDIWDDLNLHETLHGIKGKLGLVSNTLRARWKYHYFAEISMIHALWIQVMGFLFIKQPSLDE